MRNAVINRTTRETDIHVELELDGEGMYENQTGIGFFDHMLDSAFKQTNFNVRIRAKGDLEVDAHHTVEDCGIAFGMALKAALGDERGINRYGFFVLPMDESLLLCSLDLCGRATMRYDVPVGADKIGSFDTELAKEFFKAIAQNANIALHIKKLDGDNSHHTMEGVFKAFGRALEMAVTVDPKKAHLIPSTKGVL